MPFIILHLQIVAKYHYIATTPTLRSSKLLIAKTPLHMSHFRNWLTCGFWTQTGGGSLITPMALTNPLRPINSRSRNKHLNLWVGLCVSSWWLFVPVQKLCDHIHLSIRMCIYASSGNRTYIYMHRECRSVLGKLHPTTVYRTVWGECAVRVECHLLFSLVSPFVSCSMINK